VTKNFIPAAARRHAAAVDLAGYDDPALVGAIVVGDGVVPVAGNILDRDVPAAVVAGPPVSHRDPDYIEIPVRGALAPARISSDAITATSPPREGGGV